ncbi:MAG: YfhO family protein [Thermoanaerobaculaceae bacterium]|jgi:hypothetical protein|nr:YfhO family protein [Thermoanaerobaculaceae bacterium]
MPVRAIVGRFRWAGALTLLAGAVWLGLGMHRGLLLSSDIRSLAFPWQPFLAEHRSGNVDLADPAQQFVPWLQLARGELAAGRLPLWNPYQDGGVPLLGNAQSALASPLVWPALLLGVERGWNLSLLLRLLVAVAGTYLWLRDLGRSRLTAALGAVSFGMSGAFVAWLEHPHTLVAAAAPWVLWAAQRVAREPHPSSLVALVAAVWLAFVGGHPETLLLIALLAGAWVLGRAGRRGLGRTLGPALLGAGLAAPLVLPFVEYLLQSEAWASGEGRHCATLPWRTLVRLVVPDAPVGNQVETAITVSLVTLVLAAAGMVLCRGRAARTAAWMLPAMTMMAFSGPVSRLLADHTPIYWTRVLLVLPLPLAMLAAGALDRLRAWLRARGRRQVLRVLAPLAVLAAFGELLLAARGVHAVTPPGLLRMTTPLLDRLAATPGSFRVLPLGHMLPPNLATPEKLEDVRGYDALAPLGWRRQWAEVAPVRELVVRPETMRNPGPLLSFWNVEYVLASPALRGPAAELGRQWGCDLEEVYRGPDGRLLQNRSALPRARLARGGEVAIESRTPARWRLRATTATGDTLVVANPFFPGWQVRVDGRRQDVTRAPGQAFAIPLAAGTHAVELEYRPFWFFAGLGVAGISLAALAACVYRMRARTVA